MAITRYIEKVPTTTTKRTYIGSCEICGNEWQSQRAPTYLALDPTRGDDEESSGIFWCNKCCKALRLLKRTLEAPQILGSVVTEVEFAVDCFDDTVIPDEVTSLRIKAPSGEIYVLKAIPSDYCPNIELIKEDSHGN